MMSNVKTKSSKIKKHQATTGGGPSTSLALTASESRVEGLLQTEQIARINVHESMVNKVSVKFNYFKIE